MKTKLIALLFIAIPCLAQAQVPFAGGVYSQDFNSLSSGTYFKNYTNLPPGWILEGPSWSSGEYIWSPVTNGFSNNYGKFCFSLWAGDPDKSIGLVIGTTGQSWLGARIRNTSANTYQSFFLGYYIEQWRVGAIKTNDQVIPFSYSLTAAGLADTTRFTNVPALDMHSLHDGQGTAAALNGNDAANRQWVSALVTNIAWAPGTDLWIRWTGVSYPFLSAHALAVDDLEFTVALRLLLKLDPAQNVFTWPTNFAGYNLERRTSLTAGQWTAVTNNPAIDGSNFKVQLDRSPGFFRLKQLQ